MKLERGDAKTWECGWKIVSIKKFLKSFQWLLDAYCWRHTRSLPSFQMLDNLYHTLSTQFPNMDPAVEPGKSPYSPLTPHLPLILLPLDTFRTYSPKVAWTTLLQGAFLIWLFQVYRGAFVWTTPAFSVYQRDLSYTVSESQVVLLGKQHDEAGKSKIWSQNSCVRSHCEITIKSHYWPYFPHN